MTREIISNDRTGEKYTRIKHDSGLEILIWKTEGYSIKHALFGTRYGSVNTTFKTRDDADFVTVPNGIAHYLEHKLFENEDCGVFEHFTHCGVGGLVNNVLLGGICFAVSGNCVHIVPDKCLRIVLFSLAVACLKDYGRDTVFIKADYISVGMYMCWTVVMVMMMLMLVVMMLMFLTSLVFMIVCMLAHYISS